MSASFTSRDQEAAIGHFLKAPELWSQLTSMGVDKKWFSSSAAGELFEIAHIFFRENGRPPSYSEIQNEIERMGMDQRLGRMKILEKCVKSAADTDLIILKGRLTDWSKSQVLATRAIEVQAAYNKGEKTKAYKIWTDADNELRRLDLLSGAVVDSAESAPKRMAAEQAERMVEAQHTISYGVAFLDDLLVSISRKEFIIVGARTGAGKTEFATMIAKYNVAHGKRVVGFFLEAEQGEIERRIKYPMLVEKWRSDHVGAQIEKLKGMSYLDWRKGKCVSSLDGPYGKIVEKEFAEKYENFKTYYRSSGDFNANTLDRQIILNKDDADLIVVDHLQYIDIDPKGNEIAETTSLVKRMRDLSLVLGIPILVVAHLRKGSGGDSLVPDLDDFYGSGNVTKIATTVITLASCHEPPTGVTLPPGAATYIRVPKLRQDGSRTQFTGICFFDRYRGKYLEPYCVGRLNFSGTKWIPLTGEIPQWADSENVIMGSQEVVEGKNEN
jgi:replicative DNA helicase